MPAAVAQGASQQVGVPSAPVGAAISFFLGSNMYVEKIITDSYQVTSGGSQEFVHNITPGGFLQGVRVEVRSSGGTGGTAATADNPGAVLQSASLENIDGGPIIYPQDGWTHLTANQFYKPWLGPYQARFDYVAGINPSFSLYMQNEVRNTLGVLANTDARAQYRTRVTYNTGAKIFGGAPTFPLLAVTYYLETWAQPDSVDLNKNPIAPLPDGLCIQTTRRSQSNGTFNAGGSLNQMQLSNTGNELRGIMLVIRDNNGVRQDYLTDPIRWRIDTKAMGTFSPSEVFNRMSDFYPWLADGAAARPTGVYVFPRFFNPGSMWGEAWLATTNATYMIYESAANANLASPGTWQAVTDEVTPVAPVPGYLESI